MERIRRIILITIGWCFIAQTSWATTAYVTDSFRISLRRGPSIENKILKFIPSGLPVEVFESQDGWSHIQPLDDDEEEGVNGWVLSRYLITRQPWENQARSLVDKNTQQKEKLARLEKEWKESDLLVKKLTNELDANIEALQKLQVQHVKLKKDSANYLELKMAYESIKSKIPELTHENETLRSSQMNRWYATGALILLCGLIIGLLVGKQQKKHKAYL